MIRSKWFMVVLAVAFFGSVLVGAGAASAQTQQPIELSMSFMTPPKHLRIINVFDPWFKMVEERSGGKLKIKPY